MESYKKSNSVSTLSKTQNVSVNSSNHLPKHKNDYKPRWIAPSPKQTTLTQRTDHLDTADESNRISIVRKRKRRVPNSGGSYKTFKSKVQRLEVLNEESSTSGSETSSNLDCLIKITNLSNQVTETLESENLLDSLNNLSNTIKRTSVVKPFSREDDIKIIMYFQKNLNLLALKHSTYVYNLLELKYRFEKSARFLRNRFLYEILPNLYDYDCLSLEDIIVFYDKADMEVPNQLHSIIRQKMYTLTGHKASLPESHDNTIEVIEISSSEDEDANANQNKNLLNTSSSSASASNIPKNVPKSSSSEKMQKLKSNLDKNANKEKNQTNTKNSHNNYERNKDNIEFGKRKRINIDMEFIRNNQGKITNNPNVSSSENDNLVTHNRAKQKTKYIRTVVQSEKSNSSEVSEATESIDESQENSESSPDTNYEEFEQLLEGSVDCFTKFQNIPTKSNEKNANLTAMNNKEINDKPERPKLSSELKDTSNSHCSTSVNTVSKSVENVLNLTSQHLETHETVLEKSPEEQVISHENVKDTSTQPEDELSDDIFSDDTIILETDIPAKNSEVVPHAANQADNVNRVETSDQRNFVDASTNTDISLDKNICTQWSELQFHTIVDISCAESNLIILKTIEVIYILINKENTNYDLKQVEDQYQTSENNIHLIDANDFKCIKKYVEYKKMIEKICTAIVLDAVKENSVPKKDISDEFHKKNREKPLFELCKNNSQTEKRNKNCTSVSSEEPQNNRSQITIYSEVNENTSSTNKNDDCETVSNKVVNNKVTTICEYIPPAINIAQMEHCYQMRNDMELQSTDPINPTQLIEQANNVVPTETALPVCKNKSFLVKINKTTGSVIQICPNTTNSVEEATCNSKNTEIKSAKEARTEQPKNVPGSKKKSLAYFIRKIKSHKEDQSVISNLSANGRDESDPSITNIRGDWANKVNTLTTWHRNESSVQNNLIINTNEEFIYSSCRIVQTPALNPRVESARSDELFETFKLIKPKHTYSRKQIENTPLAIKQEITDSPVSNSESIVSHSDVSAACEQSSTSDTGRNSRNQTSDVFLDVDVKEEELDLNIPEPIFESMEVNSAEVNVAPSASSSMSETGSVWNRIHYVLSNLESLNTEDDVESSCKKIMANNQNSRCNNQNAINTVDTEGSVVQIKQEPIYTGINIKQEWISEDDSNDMYPEMVFGRAIIKEEISILESNVTTLPYIINEIMKPDPILPVDSYNQSAIAMSSRMLAHIEENRSNINHLEPIMKRVVENGMIKTKSEEEFNNENDEV